VDDFLVQTLSLDPQVPQHSTEQPPTPQKKVFSFSFLIFVVGCSILAGFLGYVFAKNTAGENFFQSGQKIKLSQEELKTWQTVTSNAYGYSFRMPPTWIITENNDEAARAQRQSGGLNFKLLSPYGSKKRQNEFNGITITKGKSTNSKKILESKTNTQYIKSVKKSSSKLHGKEVVIVQNTMYDQDEPTPVTQAISDVYCYGCIEKKVYILDSKSRLEVVGIWEKEHPEFEESFDKIISSLTFK